MGDRAPWLRRLFARDTAKPRVPDGRCVYAVGDIHGRRDLLATLVARIRAEGDRLDARKSLVFLGDYVDRGRDSKGVIEFLLQLDLEGWEVVFLRGNHDQSMLDFLDDPLFYRVWRGFGAQETLLSYGVLPPRFDADDAFVTAQAAFARNVPRGHIDFLHRLKFSYVAGDYLFVHAGIRPGIPPDSQSSQDMMWIRDEFLLSNRDFGKVVIHGHTPVERPVRRHNRIGIDTGAHATNCLTAAVLHGDTCRFLTTADVTAG